MARANYAQDRGGGDGAAFFMSAAVIIAGFGLGGWYLWQEQHTVISAIAIQGLHLQMMFIHLITDRFDVADAQMLATNPANVTFPQLVRIYREVGRFFLLPSVALMLVLAALCFTRAGAKRFSRALDLEGLMREQVKTFRSPAAFVHRRLGLVEIDKAGPRPADRALSAQEWAARWATQNDGSFNEAGARAELIRQLGGARRLPENTQPHVRCLITAFALHRLERREEALAFFGDLSESLGTNKREGRAGPAQPLVFPSFVVEQADHWLSLPELHETLVQTMAPHGFVTPGVMSVLIAARSEAGVLPPAQFGFLKLVDRRLWYALHSLGFPQDMFNPQLHPTPRVEAIGARDHWAAERILGEPLVLPSIDRALDAIRASLAGELVKRARG